LSHRRKAIFRQRREEEEDLPICHLDFMYGQIEVAAGLDHIIGYMEKKKFCPFFLLF
jgi:hypothetical protein